MLIFIIIMKYKKSHPDQILSIIIIRPGRSVKGSRWEGSRMRTPGGSRLEKMATPGTRLKFLWTYVKIGNDVDSNVTMCVELNEQNKNRSPAPWWSLISFDEHCNMPRSIIKIKTKSDWSPALLWSVWPRTPPSPQRTSSHSGKPERQALNDDDVICTTIELWV